MPRGKKITLHLVDGTASGIIKGQIGNWVGRVTFLKRTQLPELAKDEDINQSGIYVLSGPDPLEHNSESVYIGEGDNVWVRLKRHEQDDKKAHFERVAVITSTDKSLTKGHIRYLESRLISIASVAGRATVENGTAPELPPLPAADEDLMEEFLENITLLLPVLGLDFVLPPPQSKVTQPTYDSFVQPQPDSPLFRLTTKRQETGVAVEATAQIINGEFVILEGSTALTRMEGGYKGLKQDLIHVGSMVQEGDVFRFAKNVPFNSPSGAAAVVRGQNTNGRIYWRLDSGKTYGEWLDEHIADREKRVLSD